MQIIVVEPHAEDAFLSLGWHIERWIKSENKVHIITLSKKGSHDAEKYARKVGATWEQRDIERTKLPTGWLLLPLSWHLRFQFERKGCGYYLNQPAATDPDLSVSFAKILFGMRTVSYCSPPEEKWKYRRIFPELRCITFPENFELIVTGHSYPRRFPRV
jgi:hypothetical protein